MKLPRVMLVQGFSKARFFTVTTMAVLALGAGLWAFWPESHDAEILLIPLAALALAPFLAVLAPLWAQLCARAVQWSNLGLGVMMTVLGNGTERAQGALLALGCGATLLALGQHGLAEAERRAAFVPAAFRNSLLLLMILALADALSFALFGSLFLADAPIGVGLVLLLAAAALCVGFVLLLRMSTLGLVLDAVACLAVAGTMLTTVDAGDRSIRTILLVLSSAHVLVAAVVGVSMRRGRALLSSNPRSRALATTTVLATLMLAALVIAVVRNQ